MFNFGISTIITDDMDVFAGIDVIKESSFKFVEIRCEKGHFNYEDKGEIKRLKMILKKKSLRGISLHPPVWVDIAGGDEWTRMKSLREVEKIILVAKRLDVPKLILHPGKSDGDIGKTIESLGEIVGFAEEWDTEIILENTSPDDLGSNINELQIISREFNLPLCVDTSHASAKVNILNKLLDLFEDRIEHFHLSDSMMEGSDDHLLPYKGKINWEPVVDFIKKHNGFAIFEVPRRDNSEIMEDLEGIKSRWTK
jgi:sugar phosphate isomerase/epimerase